MYTFKSTRLPACARRPRIATWRGERCVFLACALGTYITLKTRFVFFLEYFEFLTKSHKEIYIFSLVRLFRAFNATNQSPIHATRQCFNESNEQILVPSIVKNPTEQFE